MLRAKNSVFMLICIIILVCIGIMAWGHRGQASSKVVWEYKIINIDIHVPGRLGEPERTMNQLGADGWEFVQVVHNDEISGFGGQYLFKRAK